MIQPSFLQPGDTIYITAPAKAIEESVVLEAKKTLETWGLIVRVAPHCLGRAAYFSGTDAERLADFQHGLDDPSIKAILCARGGYGCVRIVEELNWTAFQQNPKWIIGFSDVTVIHSHLNTLGVATIHGIMPVNVEKASAKVEETLRKALFGENLKYTVPCQNENRLGVAQGELVGGNLSILYSMMGSESQVDCKGKILFIEDLDEYLYHIDRMMLSLKRCGCFDGLQGLVVGSFIKMHDNEIPWGKNAHEIILDITKKYNFPIVFNFPAGHIHDNNTLIFGKKVSLEINDKETILKY